MQEKTIDDIGVGSDNEPFLERTDPTNLSHPPTWRRDFIMLSSKALPMAASYTFSLEQVATGVISLGLNGDQDHAAATVLLQTIMSASIRLSLAPLFAVSLYTSSLFGELKDACARTDRGAVANKRTEINNTLRAGYIISVFSAILACLPLLYSEKILIALGQSTKVAEIAATFLRSYTLSAPALAIRMCLGQIMFGRGDTLPAMYIGIVTFAIGVGLAAWFANGGLGLPRYGLQGMAWGLNIESYLTAVAYAIYMYKGKKYAGFNFYGAADFNCAQIKNKLSELCKIGIPITITMIVESTMVFVLGVFAGLLGVKQQAALSDSMQIVFLMFIILMAYGQATGHAVGRAKGEKKYAEASRIAKNGLIGTVVTVIPFFVFSSTAPQTLYSAFNIQNKDIQQLVKELVPIVSIGAVLQSARYNVNQVLRTVGDNKGSTVVSTIGMSLGLAVAAYLGLYTNASLNGVASGLALSEGLSLLGLAGRWKQRTTAEAIEKEHLTPGGTEARSWAEYFKGRVTCGYEQAQSLKNER